jgi:phage terminase large subunit-like protein
MVEPDRRADAELTIAPAPASWSFACPDWQNRIRERRSLMPALPLIKAEAARAVGIFDKLRLDDVAGFPPFAEVAGDWLREIIAAIFGSYDPALGVRFVRELFLLVPKKNGKTTIGACLALVWLLMNRRPRARGVLTGAMQATADIALSHTIGMIDADDAKHKEIYGDAAEGFLKKRFQVREHNKEIVDRVTKAKLQIKTFDAQILTGPPLAFGLVDELHLLRTVAAASRIIGQIRGNMMSQKEAFLGFITTQSDDAPAGAFDEELKKARAIRDGTFAGQMLPILYELPPAMVKSGAWREPANWPMVTPNLGRSVFLEQMVKDLADAEFKGEKELRRWASQHLNIEIGLALASNDWVGAQFW